MNKYSREDIFRIVEEEDVAFIRLQFCDIFGMPKNLAITPSQLEKALNNEIMFDGSSVEGFVRTDESDMYLYPDIDTFEIFVEMDSEGLESILSIEVETLKDIKRVLKKLMGLYLDAVL